MLNKLLIRFEILWPPAQEIFPDLAPGTGPNDLEIVFGVGKNGVGKIRKL